MLVIECPFCGSRDEREFTYGGPVTDPRPADAGSLDDATWVDRLTVPVNPLGPVDEWWWHERGCGEWVRIERDTLTHDVRCGSENGQ